MKKIARLKINKTARELVDFERNPPRCANCIFFMKEIKASSGIKPRPAKCKIGKFSIEGYSICNKWRDHAGNILDTN